MGAYNQYKNHFTIHRNLKEAYHLLCNAISTRNTAPDQHIIYEAFLFSAINLYARWFKNTEQKTMLDAHDYFSEGNLLDVHKSIIELRDKYIAHNQLDILGGDTADYEIVDGKVVVSSSFNKVLIAKDNSTGAYYVSDLEHKILFSLVDFHKCLICVHDKLRDELLPDKQEKLRKKVEEHINLK